MSVRKRRHSAFYIYDFRVKGQRFRGSTQTDDLETAKNIEAKLRSDALNSIVLGQTATITLNQALARYITDHVKYLKNARNVARNCALIIDFWGKNYTLDRFTNGEVSRYVSKRRMQVSNATVNRELATLRHFLNKASDEWDYQVGKVSFKKHLLKEPECRIRYLSREEAQSLVNCASPHLKPIICFALLTGLRVSNILSLKWTQIDFTSNQMVFIIKSNIPGGKKFTLPITSKLRELLLQLNPNVDDYVFTFRGKHIKEVKTAFKNATKKAGLSNFRFHDLRHTAATWMLEDGMPLDIVQRILGHTQIRTTAKYAHRLDKDIISSLESMHEWAHIGHSLNINESIGNQKSLVEVVPRVGFELTT